MTATRVQHQQLAHAINDLIEGRTNRLEGNVQAALLYERRGEASLSKLFPPDQVDELMAAWEYSTATNPLSLPEWRSILNPE